MRKNNPAEMADRARESLWLYTPSVPLLFRSDTEGSKKHLPMLSILFILSKKIYIYSHDVTL